MRWLAGASLLLSLACGPAGGSPMAPPPTTQISPASPVLSSPGIQPEAALPPVQASPTPPAENMVAPDAAAVDAVPAALFRIVWLEGKWVLPPASGEAADIELAGTTEEPILIRRSGAGEETFLITGRHGDGRGGLTATLRQPRGRSQVLRITPYEAPPAGVPAPPAGAWVVRIGNTTPEAILAWVDTSTRSQLRAP